MSILFFIIFCTLIIAWSKGNPSRERVVNRGFKVWNFIQTILMIPFCLIVGGVLSTLVVYGITQNEYLTSASFVFFSMATFRLWESFWEILWSYING